MQYCTVPVRYGRYGTVRYRYGYNTGTSTVPLSPNNFRQLPSSIIFSHQSTQFNNNDELGVLCGLHLFQTSKWFFQSKRQPQRAVHCILAQVLRLVLLLLLEHNIYFVSLKRLWLHRPRSGYRIRGVGLDDHGNGFIDRRHSR